MNNCLKKRTPGKVIYPEFCILKPVFCFSFLMKSNLRSLFRLNILFITAVLQLLASVALAQRIENVRTAQEGKTIVVTYDLTGLSSDQSATVKLFYSEDGGATWGSVLQKVTGDAGSGIKAGTGKRIVWDVLAERERFVGESMVFEVRASLAATRLSFEPEMVFIQGGTFQMGSNEGEDDEKPLHSVSLSSFYMGKYEVTQKQWQEVMGSNPSDFKNCANCPVETVSWDDVQEYIHKLNQRTGKQYRLPTEAEWEYACRAGSATPFNTGACLKTAQANYDGNYPYTGCSQGEYRHKTTPVGTFTPNAWGLYDMHGNVYEWCSDCYGFYCSASQANPAGPSEGASRVLRGGSWLSHAHRCCSAFRLNYFPSARSYVIGFRLVSPR